VKSTEKRLSSNLKSRPSSVSFFSKGVISEFGMELLEILPKEAPW